MQKSKKPLQAVIKLKLGACINMPSKRASLLMQQIGLNCDRARNVALRFWERWREDNPNWVPQQRRTRRGEPKTNQDGTPVMESPAYSQDTGNAMYHAARNAGGGAARSVNTGIISVCSAEICDWLKTKMPYNHDGDAKFRWEAILKDEINRPTFRSRAIPLPAQQYKFEKTNDHCTLQCTLLSKEAGYSNRTLTFRLEVSGLPAGKRRWLQRAADGEVKLRDSELKYDRGSWYCLLVCDAKHTADAPDPTKKAVLKPLAGKSKNPWELRFDTDDAIYLGDGAAVKAEFRRRLARIRSLGSKYRYSGGGGTGTGPSPGSGRGHGKSRYFAKVKPLTRGRTDFATRMRNQVIADIVKACVRNNCGTLEYREPSLHLRDSLWYNENGIDFDWTSFLGHLRFVAARHNILMDDRAKRVTRKEYVSGG